MPISQGAEAACSRYPAIVIFASAVNDAMGKRYRSTPSRFKTPNPCSASGGPRSGWGGAAPAGAALDKGGSLAADLVALGRPWPRKARPVSSYLPSMIIAMCEAMHEP